MVNSDCTVRDAETGFLLKNRAGLRGSHEVDTWQERQVYRLVDWTSLGAV